MNDLQEHRPISKRTIMLGASLQYLGWAAPLWGIWHRRLEEKLEIYMGKLCLIINWRNE